MTAFTTEAGGIGEAILTRLESLENHFEQTRPKTKYIRIRQVSQLTGLSVGHLYRLVHEKRIPFIKKYGTLFFLPDEISQWMESGREVLTRAEAEAEKTMTAIGDRREGRSHENTH